MRRIHAAHPALGMEVVIPSLYIRNPGEAGNVLGLKMCEVHVFFD
jgi:hypothetical protein